MTTVAPTFGSHAGTFLYYVKSLFFPLRFVRTSVPSQIHRTLLTGQTCESLISALSMLPLPEEMHILEMSETWSITNTRGAHVTEILDEIF